VCTLLYGGVQVELSFDIPPRGISKKIKITVKKFGSVKNYTVL